MRTKLAAFEAAMAQDEQARQRAQLEAAELRQLTAKVEDLSRACGEVRAAPRAPRRRGPRDPERAAAADLPR